MKLLIILFMIFFTTSCNKPKVVLICGDHVCVNKAEADQYFQENLSLEVKVINSKIKKKINLIELNMKNNKNGKREIKVLSKKTTNKDLKTLSNKEINKIKKNIKKKKKEKKIAKKSEDNKLIKKEKKSTKDKKLNSKKNLKNVSKSNINNLDVCTILEKCNIEEISKYLLKQEKGRKFPDITRKQ